MSTDCPVCGSASTRTLIAIDRVPVFCNVLYEHADEARSAAQAPMELRFCDSCTHCFNGRFDPSLVAYSPTYENALHFSATFRAYAQTLVERLVREHALHDADIVEVGCGDGTFLKQLCEAGGNRGWGFDPSREAGVDGPVTFVKEYYSETSSEVAADFVCCRHVLEHIGEPIPFLTSIAHTMRSGGDARGYFEVPNSLYTLRDHGIWDIIYEHCSYFSPVSLRTALNTGGFGCLRLEEEYGGQFLGADVNLSGGRATDEQTEQSEAEDIAALADAFARFHEETLAHWQKKLAGFADSGRRVVSWGAGSKGVTFLNLADRGHVVDRIADINPRKRGHFVPGGGQQVVSPDMLGADAPDTVILMNPVYRDEVGTMLSELGISCEIEVV